MVIVDQPMLSLGRRRLANTGIVVGRCRLANALITVGAEHIYALIMVGIA